MNEPIRMSADDLVVLLLSSREHTTLESDARRLLAEVKDNHFAEKDAEIDRLRQDNRAAHASEQILQQQIDAQAKEIDRLRTELAPFQALDLGAVDSRVSASCADPKHPTWLRTADDTRGCPWCRIAELERPAVEAERAEIRQSFMELSAQAREDRDYEGAFNVDCNLREREQQWARQDAADIRELIEGGDR